LSVAADYPVQHDIRDYIKKTMPDITDDALECMVSDLLSNMYNSHKFGFDKENIRNIANQLTFFDEIKVIAP